MSSVGRHLLAELSGCDRLAIDDAALVERAMREAVAASGATLLHLRVHDFEPQGVTALALLSESHLALHTWPERGYAAADLFTCGDHVVGERAIAILERTFAAGSVSIRAVERGPIAARNPASPTPNNVPSPGTHDLAGHVNPDRDAGRPHRVADAAVRNPQPSTLNPTLAEDRP